jgi:ribose transport system ATP-binding protein
MEFLEVSGLTKRYGGIVALSGANFSARRGEVHALLGENGAGKSTLIQVLAGAVRHDGGTIALDGNPYRPSNPDDAAACGVSAVFQELSLVPDLAVDQNIWFRREAVSVFGTVRRAQLRRKTMELFEAYRFPLISPDEEVRRLTLAERQIVEIAKALARSPSVLILDEATSALPAREAEWLLGLSRQLAAEGKLVIFISHRMAEVRHIADRMTIFRNGKTVAAHDAGRVSDDDVVSAMLGRKLERLYPERIATATGRVALRVRDFSVGRRVHGIGFDLQEGEVLGVGGLQGHGQRELFQGLFGSSRAHGIVEIWGNKVTIRSPRQALTGREGMALVPEDRRGQGILLTKSVRENLTLSVISRFSRFGLLSRRKEEDLVKEMVDFLRIRTSSPEQPAGTLSGGNQQKVIFGKMLLTQARILLLFDPTRGVDVGTKGEIFDLMRKLAGDGYAILFFSSDLAELVHVADRVIVMRNGELAATLAGQANTEEGILRAAVFEKQVAQVA